MNRFFQSFFFGNYFYGACALALSIEANRQLGYPLNNWLYYAAIFLATVLYYTHAYLSEHASIAPNPRSTWYRQHQQTIRFTQLLYTLLLLVMAWWLLRPVFAGFNRIPAGTWLFMALFPLAAMGYYAHTLPFWKGPSLRNHGWIKPFVIGFIWAGAVTLFPPVYSALCHPDLPMYQPAFFNTLLLVKNGMFITMLCILFDIKDYAADHNQQLKTFVVRYGLRKTLFWIIIPLTIIGLTTLITYAVSQDFPVGRILINTIPFILLITVTYHMHRRKSILYYLAIIDGLMLVKACCGIIGSFLF